MMEYFIILTMGIAAGYLLGSVSAIQQRKNHIQELIDLEAISRRANGLHRKGDDLTETEPVECGVIRTREISR